LFYCNWAMDTTITVKSVKSKLSSLAALLFSIILFTSLFPKEAGASDLQRIEETFPKWEIAANGFALALDIYLTTLPEAVPSFGPPSPGSLDYKIMRNHVNLNHDHFNDLSNILVTSLTVAPPAVYLGNYLFPSLGIEAGGLKMLAFLEVCNFTALTTQSSKKLLGRERPDEGGTDAFISGHTSTAFSAAAFLSWDMSNLTARLVSEDAPVALQASARALPFAALYTTAGLVGYYRIAAEKHWFTDVAAGAITGAFIGNFFYLLHFHEDGSPRRTVENVSLYPILEPDFRGIGLVWNF